MNRFVFPRRIAAFLSLVTVSVLIGAQGMGCGGSDDDCVTGGCSGELCVEAGYESDVVSTCEYRPEYDCYKKHSTCGRISLRECGWDKNQALLDCLSLASRVPVSNACTLNAADACSSDADCKVGGCGGELCYNPAKSNGASDCNCTTPPSAGCGCVDGICTWWQ